MTDPEVELLVLDVVRRYTQNESVAPGTRLDKDLHLSDAARQMLFASLAQAFAARGENLPERRFYLSDFLACPTPAAVRDAIRAKAFKAVAPKAAAPAATASAPESKPAADRTKPAAKKPAARKKAPQKKPAPKKSAGAAKRRRGKR